MTYARQFDFTPLDRGFSAELDVELDAIVTAFDGLKQRKYKTADQDRAGVVIDDVHLQGFTLEAGGIYSVFGIVHITEAVATAGDTQFHLDVSQALSGDSFLLVLGMVETAGQFVEDRVAIASSGTNIGPAKPSGVEAAKNPMFKLDGIIVAHASLASTLKLQWGPAAAGTTRMHAGSFMFVEKLN